jgi:phospholipase C
MPELPQPRTNGLQHIQHIVVLMLENRSFDHVCGLLYSGERRPLRFLPAHRNSPFNGMPASFSNPSNPDYFSSGAPPNPVPVRFGADDHCIPHQNPQERFEHVNFQLFGTSTPAPGQQPAMNGFFVSFLQTGAKRPEEIMQCYTPEQMPVLSALARNFAVCDEWYASVPTQTWPNRAFFHMGTSLGQVDDYPYDPFNYDAPTIFNVLGQQKVSWAVFNDSLLESTTRLQFPQLWDLLLEPHFQNLEAFERDARTGTLPAYSFLEPSFLIDPNDAHPPHDMLLADRLIWRVWQAVSSGAHWDSTLLLITFDEHGGCIDHQPPPYGAVPPDDHPAEQGFAFDRYGVRVPMVAVSPWIEPGVVFRSPTESPYDHTSVIATIRDWLSIPAEQMLKSRRVDAAPTLDHLLTRAQPRTEVPAIAYPEGTATRHRLEMPANDFQRGMMLSFAHRAGIRGGIKLLEKVHQTGHVAEFFETYKQRHRRD